MDQAPDDGKGFRFSTEVPGESGGNLSPRVARSPLFWSGRSNIWMMRRNDLPDGGLRDEAFDGATERIR